MKTRILAYSRVYNKNRETCKLYFQHPTTGSIGDNNLLANNSGQHTFAPAITRNLWLYKWLLHCMGRRGGNDAAVKMPALLVQLGTNMDAL